MKILEQQDTGTCTKSVKIEVPVEDIDKELEGVYKEFMSEATVPGFRKGKAPRHIVKMKFGKHLDQEARTKAVETAFDEAMKELDIKPVTSPDLSDIDTEKTDEPIVFEAKFEYAPKLELAEYKDINPDLPPAEITEKEVVEHLNYLREQSAMYQSVDDRPAAENDFAIISTEATMEGQPFEEGTHGEVVIEIGTKRYLPGLEDALIGMKPGDKKEVSITLNEEYPNEEYRGKEVTFNIELKQLQEKKLPELDDEFAKDMGHFENLSELKDRIRDDLSRHLESRQKQLLRDAICDELVKRNSFDVPPSMVKARYNYINAVHDMDLRRSGTSLEEEAKRDEGLLARHEEAAERQVRISLILDEIAKREGIEVGDNDYQSYIARLARQAGQDADQYRRRIEQQGIESYYRREALEEMVLDYLQDRADIAKAQAASAAPDADLTDQADPIDQADTEAEQESPDEQDEK